MNRELIFIEVIERAKEALGCRQDNELASVLGITPQVLGNRKKTKSIPFPEIIQAARDAGADLSYILTGEQKPKLKINETKPSYKGSDYAEIPHFDVKAAAGTGVINAYEESLKSLSFRRDWLAKRHLSVKDLVIVDVVGDSMEPYLKDSDLVLVDRSQTEIASGKTYVLRMDGHLLVKNLQLLPMGMIQVASFNTGFPPYQVDLTNEALDMAVIGRVVASMHEW